MSSFCFVLWICFYGLSRGVFVMLCTNCKTIFYQNNFNKMVNIHIQLLSLIQNVWKPVKKILISMFFFTESGCPFRIRHLDDVIDSDTTDLHRKEKEEVLRYRHLNSEEYETVDKLLRGGLPPEKIPCQKPKVVRVFVCSSGPGKNPRPNYSKTFFFNS